MRLRLPCKSVLCAFESSCLCGYGLFISFFICCIFESSLVYAKYHPKYQTFAHQVLDLEARELGIQPNYGLLDEMIDEVCRYKETLYSSYSRKGAIILLRYIDDMLLNRNFLYNGGTRLLSQALEPRRLNQKMIQHIRQFNPNHSGIDFRNKETRNRIVLPDQRHKIHASEHLNENFYFAECVTFTFIYLGIADVLNLPIHMVLAPSHVFVRWQFGNGYLNWETTSGRVVADEYIRDVFDISASSIRSGVYLKSLNRTESLATAYYMLSNFANSPDKKIRYLTTALTLNPNHSSAYYNRGTLWYQTGHLQKALSDFDRAIELDPHQGEAFNNRGNIWYKMEKFDKALADYNQAIALNPGHSRAYNNRGNIWYQKGVQGHLAGVQGHLAEDLLDRALSDYNKAIALDPAYGDAYNNRGNVWYQKGIYKNALADYNKAIELNPNHKDAVKNRLEIWEK